MDEGSYRLLNIIDDHNWQVLAIEADTSLPVLRLLRVLNRLKEVHGLPKMIRVGNGSEFISYKLDHHWCKAVDVHTAWEADSEYLYRADERKLEKRIAKCLCI